MKKNFLLPGKSVLFLFLALVFAFSACANLRRGNVPGSTAANPIIRAENIYLGCLADSSGGWQALLSEIETAGKYIKLDLSASTMSGAAFNPDPRVAAGKRFIVSLILPDAATSINNWAPLPGSNSPTFSKFSQLQEVVGANITHIGNSAFAGSANLTSAYFPLAESIGNFAFRYSGLIRAYFPQAVTIGNNAFAGSASLVSAYFPRAASVGNLAFAGCENLTSISLPQVSSIGNMAFESCPALTGITLGHFPPTLGWGLFNNGGTQARTVTFYVPDIGAYTAAAAPWAAMMGPWTSLIGHFWDLHPDHRQFLTVHLTQIN